MSIINQNALEITSDNLSSFTANISAGALHYASTFRASKEGRGCIEGIRIAPHVSGKGVVLVALDGISMGIFYDACGHVDGACTLDLDDAFYKDIKPAKSSKQCDVRVSIFNNTVYAPVKNVEVTAPLKIRADNWTADFEGLLTRFSRGDGTHLDTLVLPPAIQKKFFFSAYPGCSCPLYTQYIKRKINTTLSPFSDMLYIVRHAGVIPFDFMGAAMPYSVSHELYKSNSGIPSWAI